MSEVFRPIACYGHENCLRLRLSPISLWGFHKVTRLPQSPSSGPMSSVFSLVTFHSGRLRCFQMQIAVTPMLLELTL